ncbi:MAG: DUF488 domain-containing protein [candidate division WOR-3 bacterium]
MACPVFPLLTAGYEGRTTDEFIAVLKQEKVAVVADVRQLPLSRRRGFSKSALATFLPLNGIQYVSLRELGTPVAVRKQYRMTGSFEELARQYLAYVATVDDSVESLYQMAVAKPCCLLCYERDPKQCHRSLLALVLAGRNGHQFVVRHL